MAHREAISELYLRLLHRQVDEVGLSHWLKRLDEGQAIAEIETSIKESDEYRNAHRQVGAIDLLRALHRSRVELVRQLPVAKRMLDLGGGAVGDPRGALVVMGYPYAFEELNIIEPPPENRHELYRNIPDVVEVVDTVKGPVKYHYGSMADLSRFDSGSLDMVFSGETIEHVSVEDCKKTLREVRRVLRPSGFFCFDTPNRDITVIQSPNHYINPEHKIEYTHTQMCTLLAEAGLRIVEEKGVTYMPETLRTREFQESEMLNNVGLYADLTKCYLLYYRCQAA
jgi:predicted SAM-dependent methyltransferase